MKKKWVLNFKDFIDVDYHSHKIKRHAQKIKNEYAPIADPIQYSQSLFDFFLDDIKNIANEIYENLLEEVNKRSIKLSTSELKNCIVNGIQYFFAQYESIINGYRLGGMFREHEKLPQDLTTFKARAEQRSKALSESICSKYVRSLKKERNEKWTFWATITAAVMSTIGVGLTAIGLLPQKPPPAQPDTIKINVESLPNTKKFNQAHNTHPNDMPDFLSTFGAEFKRCNKPTE